MKAVILAGGFGTRISEESHLKPKPMIEIGEKPILWHIMKELSYYGIKDFIICAGYKQHVIKEWFANYFLHTSDITFKFSQDNSMVVHNKHTEDWEVTVVDTGLNTATGGRIKRIQPYIGNESFLVTYGDAVADINIGKLAEYHKNGGKIGTISLYNFGQSKGVVELRKDGGIGAFREKSDLDGDLINIGYMIFEPTIFNYLPGDYMALEGEPLYRLVNENQLDGYIHKGFWQCMDTLREKQKLEKYWEEGNAPWMVWN